MVIFEFLGVAVSSSFPFFLLFVPFVVTGVLTVVSSSSDESSDELLSALALAA